MDELTPQVASLSMLLIILCAPTLTLLLSTLLLWRYKRAVTRAMSATGAFPAETPETNRPAPPARSGSRDDHDRTSGDLYRWATRSPWHSAIRHALAGLAFALVFALAARFVYPFRLDWPGFLIGVWIYAWPVVLAVPLIVRGSLRLWAASVVAYCVAVLLLGSWAATVHDMPEFKFGGVDLPTRSSATPLGLLRLWLVVNGAPTLLMWFCFNRRIRAVAALVLALVTTAIGGSWIALLTLFSSRGVDAAVALSVWLAVHVYWLVFAVLVLAVAGFGAIGWALTRWIARAYRRRRLSDQSLLLDAVWLLFASSYAMWLALGGVMWMATAPAAFLAYKLVLWGARRVPGLTPNATLGLTFLRVFTLGRRSDSLFDAVARYWRHLGNVQIITGPDVALSTVQPHQFLDYLSGKLSEHFVRDQASLERSLAERDRRRDPDGRFRIHNLFCHADAWKAALSRLGEEGDAVLMDLRSFSATNTGCIHELRHLVQKVPIDRCLLIVDDTTDQAFLERTLKEAWQQVSPGSPNHGRGPEATTLHRYESGTAALRRLVRLLCDACPPATVALPPV